MDRTLWPAIGLLVALFALFELTHLDLVVQDWFFNFTPANGWSMPRPLCPGSFSTLVRKG